MRWIFRGEQMPPFPDEAQAWAEELEISGRLARFLWQRGLSGKEAMRDFLNPALRGLAPLCEWPGLEEAARVLVDALLEGKKVCVWGDYDVDGITAAALMVEFFSFHGFDAAAHIPNRLTEGYGLNVEGIERLASEGAGVLLTVDCGISDIDAVRRARELGLVVVVSDHHLPGDELPPASAIVNPRLFDCPCPALAGVGVAFFLAAAVNVLLHEQHGRQKMDVRTLLDLVALGTLADVVDLGGQNRILVKNGLLGISQARRVGIAALKSACGFAAAASLGAGQVVFTLAPRINAAGRLGSGTLALELMLEKDRTRAAASATELSRLNAERRDEEDIILKEALVQAEEQVAQGRMGLVLYSPGWHPGIIGIVASRVVEALHRPTVVMSLAGDFLKGSGRSVPGFDIHGAFASCAELLLGYGGHTMAAGLSLAAEQLEAFRTRFDKEAAALMDGTPHEPECRVDDELSFAEVEFHLLKELEMLQPFGMGNAEPVFASPPVRVRSMRGRTGFMQLDLLDESSGRALTAKAWRQKADIPMSLKGKLIRIAYTPRIDRYNGAATIELRLKDWKEEKKSAAQAL